MQFNSFDQVVTEYNNTHPIRGERKPWDLRPLGDRSRWWERIIKIDDNTYALSDGNSAYATRTREATEEALAEVRREAMLIAPIVWMRKADGDYVRIRGSINHGWSTSRYAFLSKYLPSGMLHGNDNNGIHWIQTGGERHLLPIFKHDWGKHKNTEDKYLDFKLVDQKFVLTSKKYKKTVPVVNRELTKHYNPKIKEMWETMKIILPVLGTGMRDVLNQQEKNEALPAIGWSGQWTHGQYATLVRDCLDNPEDHEVARYALMVMTAVMSDNVHEKYIWERNDGRYESRFVDSGKNSYDRFRRFMHKIGDMLTTKEVDFE